MKHVAGQALYLWSRYGWIVLSGLMVWAIREDSALFAAAAAALASSSRCRSRVYVARFEAKRYREDARTEWMRARLARAQFERLRDKWRGVAG